MRRVRKTLWRGAVPRRCPGQSGAATRPRRRGITAGFIALATLAASVLLVAVPAGPAQAAPLRSTPLITYNMLGADSGSDTKWTTTVGRYARSAEIVAIQEAGPTPPGEFVDNSANIAGLPAIGRGNFIQHHRWRFGHESYEVYFLQTDPNRGTYVGNRNNVALLTQREADEVTAIPNPHRNGRAMVGVRFDDDWYFSYHALSGNETTGGRDARDMLARVDAFVSQQPGRQWTVMGDFNREPTDLVIPAGSRVYSTGQPTQVGGRELDFAVSSADIPNHPRERQPGATADHFAAAVGPLRTPTEPRRLFSSSRYIESMQTGTVLAPTAAPWSGEWLETQRRDPEDASQRFDIEFDDNAGLRIREPGGECATVSTLEPHTLSLRDCSNSLSHQRFEFVSLGNDQYQIRSVRTGQCVEQGSSETSFVRMRRCADVDGQHWTLPQQHQDLNEPNFETGDLPVAYTGSEGLQNLYTGQMLTGEPRGLPTTTVRAEQRHTAPTPTGAEWSMEWRGEYLRLRDPVTRECVELGDPPPFSDSPAGVDLNPCTDSSAQLWKVDPYAGKAFRLQSRQAEDTPGGVCLSLSGDNELGDRLDIVQATRCDSPLGSQIWSFAPYSTATDQPPPTP